MANRETEEGGGDVTWRADGKGLVGAEVDGNPELTLFKGFVVLGGGRCSTSEADEEGVRLLRA